MKNGSRALLILLVALFFIPMGARSARSDDTGFSMPGTAPLYPAPPWKYVNSRAVVIVFETTREILQEILPPPLAAHAGNLAFLYIGKYTLESPLKLSFHEAGIGIPSSYETTQGKYAAYMYADKVIPIAGGREIWGAPKKGAEIRFEEKGRKVTAEVRSGGTAIIQVSLSKDKKLDPKMGWTDAPWFALKLIPSAKKDAPPDVRQLTSTMSRDTIKELYAGKATLRFASSSDDPMGKIKVLRMYMAEFAVYDSEIGYGEVLHDYLAKDKKSPETGR